MENFGQEVQASPANTQIDSEGPPPPYPGNPIMSRNENSNDYRLKIYYKRYPNGQLYVCMKRKKVSDGESMFINYSVAEIPTVVDRMGQIWRAAGRNPEEISPVVPIHRPEQCVDSISNSNGNQKRTIEALDLSLPSKKGI